MDQVLNGYTYFLAVLRIALFWIAVVVGVIALVDWLVRTRRLNPFGPIGRFSRQFLDPLMVPVERRIVRAGGQPTSAPWWTLVFVVVGGLLLIAVLNFLGGVLVSAFMGLSSPGAFALLLLSWAFAVLRIALIVRVLSSWFQISPWSKWVRWSFVLTEWMIAPLRQVLPSVGPIDISPLIAWLLLSLLQRVLGIP
jgi:YggT family protein